MHLPRPKLFRRKRKAKPDKPIRNFFQRFFCVFALCVTSPQPVTVAQDEKVRYSWSNGRRRRQRTPKYEERVVCRNADIDSLFTANEISDGLPVLPSTSDHTILNKDLDTESTADSLWDDLVTPLDDFDDTLSSISDISDASSIISNISHKSITDKEELSNSDDLPSYDFTDSLTNISITTMSSITSDCISVQSFNANDVFSSPDRATRSEKVTSQWLSNSSRCLSNANSVDSFHDIFGILDGSLQINHSIETESRFVADQEKYNNGNDQLNEYDIVSAFVIGIIDKIVESENPNKEKTNGSKIITNETLVNKEDSFEFAVKETTINQYNLPVNKTVNNNKDIGTNITPIDDEYRRYVTDFLTNIIDVICNKASGEAESFS